MAINIRKLAALDMALIGPRIIVAEFTFGVFGPIGLGLLSLGRMHARLQKMVGVYLILLGINYIPMLIYTLVIYRRRSAQEEVADELAQRTKIASRYFPQTLLLLIPLVVPFLAITQELRRHKPAVGMS